MAGRLGHAQNEPLIEPVADGVRERGFADAAMPPSDRHLAGVIGKDGPTIYAHTPRPTYLFIARDTVNRVGAT